MKIKEDSYVQLGLVIVLASCASFFGIQYGRINSAYFGGGGGAGSSSGFASGSGGGGGCFIEAIITSPSSTYSYAVGALGSAGGNGTSGFGGGSGAAGQIIVEEHY